jgi:hypothetical protein
MKRKKLLAVLGLSCAMLATTPVMAATVSPATSSNGTETAVESAITESKTSACDVEVTVGETFEVSIPKKVVLSGADKNGSYTVTVKGDIGDSHFVTVTPAGTVTLSQTGKTDVTAAITQETKKFLPADTTATASTGEAKMDLSSASSLTEYTGNIYADGTNNSGTVSAGTWTGNFNFSIALES